MECSDEWYSLFHFFVYACAASSTSDKLAPFSAGLAHTSRADSNAPSFRKPSWLFLHWNLGSVSSPVLSSPAVLQYSFYQHHWVLWNNITEWETSRSWNQDVGSYLHLTSGYPLASPTSCSIPTEPLFHCIENGENNHSGTPWGSG